MAIDFPNAPTVGEIYTDLVTSISWVWDGEKWTFNALSPSGVYLPLSGGTLTGPVDTTSSIAIQTAGQFLLGGGAPGYVLSTDGSAGLTWIENVAGVGQFLPLTGGTLTGPLVLSGIATAPLQAVPLLQLTANLAAALLDYLPLAGGTMIGPIELSADPVDPLEPVTLQYFEQYPMIGDNRIINGDMRIDQRNNGAVGTANGYTLDRWYYFGTQTGIGNWRRNPNSAPTPPGFPYSLCFVSLSAYTALATDQFFFNHPIEADHVSDFMWGTPQAQPVTLSFWVSCTQTGTFSGSVGNYAATRSYPFTFSIPTANEWMKIAITIPGDTAGTWVMSGNGGSVNVNFDLGSGANFRAAAGAWATGTFWGATSAASVVATNNAQWFVTGVKLEIGTVATPFNRKSLAESMSDCQRYFNLLYGLWLQNYGSASENISMMVFFPRMRVAPTLLSGSVSNPINLTNPTASIPQPNSCLAGGSATANGSVIWNFNLELTAEL
jgi:hypothetical protein